MSSFEDILLEQEESDENTSEDDNDMKDSGTAWLVCFFIVLNELFVTGVINIFGIFFVEFMKEFGSSKGKSGEVRHVRTEIQMYMLEPRYKCTC